MIILQVIEATNALMETSKEQGFLVFFLCFLLVVLGGLIWWYMQKLETKNQAIQDCYKDQVKVEVSVQQYAKQVDERLKDINNAMRNNDTHLLRQLIADLGFSVRNNQYRDE
ncbi:cell division protein YceG involved in septum cleavage [Catalinimonas alkaloidigena]|uniref:hypothetical protein n=1 Tax=Catalinimonas alkaloidigena TaxID=1075417 RepID=UPI002405295E|nr:hypothetical protein [Catalinimonas alkaloidigena]MDF9795388.1 cell division protein YceG involved in septum cleavage [Catalinimonas alkaloidigena]